LANLSYGRRNGACDLRLCPDRPRSPSPWPPTKPRCFSS